jgi:hypothetical protein
LLRRKNDQVNKRDKARVATGIIAVDVEDFGMAWGNALGRLFTDSAN